MIVGHLITLKKFILDINDGTNEDVIDYIEDYEMTMSLIKEWISQSGIATKLLLIKELPLCKDVNQFIYDLNLKLI